MVLVPEAAMHKDRRLIRAKDNVGATWQIALVKSKSVSKSVKKRPHSALWPRVFAFDACHQAAAALWVEVIHGAYGRIPPPQHGADEKGSASRRDLLMCLASPLATGLLRAPEV